MLDDYGGKGYTPFLTNDLATGVFNKATDISFDTHCRHGSFLPLKKSEFDALCTKYDLAFEEAPREHKEVFSMSFEDNTNVNTGSVAATASGPFTYEEGVKTGTKAAKFDSTDFIAIDKSAIAGLDAFTVSFAAKFSDRSWVFYASSDDKAPKDGELHYTGVVWGASGSTKLAAERFLKTRTPSPSKDFTANPNEWKHITVVFGLRYTTIYVNGEEFATEKTSVYLKKILGDNPTIYIGRANWASGEYSDFVLDEFKIHNWGMTADEVAKNYRAVMGVAE